MSPQQTASFAALIAAWLAFSWKTAWALATRAQKRFDDGGEVFKDLVFDMGSGEAGVATASNLPPLPADEFISAMREPVEEVLCQVAQIINEDSADDWKPVTEERINALFARLGKEALTAALDVRVAQAESQLPERRQRGEWAHRYRRLLAESGRWPG
jgi:hypothetical protein